MPTEVEAVCEVDHAMLVLRVLRGNVSRLLVKQLKEYLPIREAFVEC